MACPQKENGNTPIANEIMEALCRFRIPGEVRQVIDFIIRKTYGWHKKMDTIANSQFIKATGLKKGNVSRSIKIAMEHKLVIKSDNKVGFNKNYEQWIGFGKLSKVITPVIRSDNKKLSEVRDTKESKENIQKKDGIPYFLTSSFKWKKEKRKHIEAGGRVVDGYILTEKDGIKLLMKKDENGKKVWKDYKQYKLTHKNYGL